MTYYPHKKIKLAMCIFTFSVFWRLALSQHTKYRTIFSRRKQFIQFQKFLLKKTYFSVSPVFLKVIFWRFKLHYETKLDSTIIRFSFPSFIYIIRAVCRSIYFTVNDCTFNESTFNKPNLLRKVLFYQCFSAVDLLRKFVNITDNLGYLNTYKRCLLYTSRCV